jgi:tryptophanyl-tRNA synthetase
LTLYQLLSGQSKEAVATECAEMGWGQFKPLFMEATIEALRPIQERYHALTDDRSQVEAVLREGKESATVVAQHTLQAVKDALGFSRSL